jgi:hypothetical protein
VPAQARARTLTLRPCIFVHAQCANFNFGSPSPLNASSPGLDYAFSDDAAYSLSSSCAPVIAEGLYQSASPYVAGITTGDMSALAGQSAAGLWQLTVQDMAPTDAGFFDDIMLRIRGVNGEVRGLLACLVSVAGACA